MPLKGLYKDDIPEATLRRIQGTIKRNIPTGRPCLPLLGHLGHSLALPPESLTGVLMWSQAETAYPFFTNGKLSFKDFHRPCWQVNAHGHITGSKWRGVQQRSTDGFVTFTYPLHATCHRHEVIKVDLLVPQCSWWHTSHIWPDDKRHD